jgi:hypothetical protein
MLSSAARLPGTYGNSVLTVVCIVASDVVRSQLEASMLEKIYYTSRIPKMNSRLID